MKKFDTWEIIKEFINTHDKFTPKEITLYIHNIKKENNINYSNNTINQYILLILNCGFIDRVDRGKYIKIINIPKYISSSSISKLSYVEKYAYDNVKRKQFITILSRKEKLQKLNNLKL